MTTIPRIDQALYFSPPPTANSKLTGKENELTPNKKLVAIHEILFNGAIRSPKREVVIIDFNSRGN